MKQRTAKELEQMMIDELDNIEGCQGIKSIGIYNIVEPGYPNWSPSFANFGNGDAHLCESALQGIVKRFQAEYELIADNT